MALLVAATCLLYAGDLELGFFHWDDGTYVPGNPHIQGATADNLAFVLTQPYFSNYSPLHLLSYMLDHALGGLDPRVYHLSSNVWGGLAAAGVYLLGLMLFVPGQRGDGSSLTVICAAAAAALFVVHPSHVEAIAWISSRKDLVAAAFALPAVAAYLVYRRGGPRRRLWYGLSLGLFLLGLAGKLSVIVVPGILLLFDIFVERRWDKGLLLDKIPFGLLSVFFALRVLGAQPPTRAPFELHVFGLSTLHCLFLLSGFGEQVLARSRPGADLHTALRALWALAPLLLFIGPALLWKRLSGKAVVLAYWVLLALVPAQVLSFIHPVADRYLFFPSAGLVLLLGLAGTALARKGRWGRAVVTGGALLLLLLWGRATLGYLAQWQDPRSIWYAASTRSDDPVVFLHLGTHYQDEADRLPASLSRAEGMHHAADLARAVWAGDKRLSPLLSGWDRLDPGARHRAPETAAFQAHLRQLAAGHFQQALAAKGRQVLPNLYFRLGKLATDRGDHERAVAQFELALRESRRHTSPRVRDELAVRSLHAMAITRWRQRNYQAAMVRLREAQAEQARQGTTWIPQMAQQIRQLQGLLK